MSECTRCRERYDGPQTLAPVQHGVPDGLVNPLGEFAHVREVSLEFTLDVQTFVLEHCCDVQDLCSSTRVGRRP